MGSATKTVTQPAAQGETSSVNEVHLLGRLSVAPLERDLPSGDVVVLLRLVVPRPPVTRRGRSVPRGDPERKPSPVTVDTLELACWSAATRRVAGRLDDGAVVEVWGALRRRFFRAGGGAQSRYEVEVSRIRRARTPGRGAS